MATRGAGRSSGGGERNKPSGTRAARALSANMEDYIEAIYRLSKSGSGCRVSAIAEALDVKRPSVSKALKRLHQQGLVSHLPYGKVRVTEQGCSVAERQVRNHKVLTRFMCEVLGLPTELAEHDACLMEHAISNETVERLVEFISHLEEHGPSHARFGTTAPRARKARGKAAAKPARSWKSRV